MGGGVWGGDGYSGGKGGGAGEGGLSAGSNEGKQWMEWFWPPPRLQDIKLN